MENRGGNDVQTYKIIMEEGAKRPKSTATSEKKTFFSCLIKIML